MNGTNKVQNKSKLCLSDRMHLVEISEVLLNIKQKFANEIFGSPYDLKLCSSMTLLGEVKNSNPVFMAVLEKYFNKIPDRRTLELIEKHLSL